MLGPALLLGGIAALLLPWLFVRRLRPGRPALPNSRPNALQIGFTDIGQHPVRFSSVGGAAAAKAALLRLSAPLRPMPSDQDLPETRSGSYRAAMNAVGGVLHGPPGCGKSLLARALAGELNLPLFTISAAELVRLPTEIAERQLRELFAAAVQRAPCLLLIDELDALATARTAARAAGGAGEVLVGLLVSLLDGLSRQPPRVVVLGTARGLDRVDETLLRIDRLMRAVALTLPETRERSEIIALLAREHPELAGLDVLALAARTDGHSGASLRELLARAARHAAERQRSDPASPAGVEAADLEHALTAVPARPPAAG